MNSFNQSATGDTRARRTATSPASKAIISRTGPASAGAPAPQAVSGHAAHPAAPDPAAPHPGEVHRGDHQAYSQDRDVSRPVRDNHVHDGQWPMTARPANRPGRLVGMAALGAATSMR